MRRKDVVATNMKLEEKSIDREYASESCGDHILFRQRNDSEGKNPETGRMVAQAGDPGKPDFESQLGTGHKTIRSATAPAGMAIALLSYLPWSVILSARSNDLLDSSWACRRVGLCPFPTAVL